MEENNEDKDKAHCGAKWRQLLAFRWSDVTLHVYGTGMQWLTELESSLLFVSGM